MTTGRPSLNCVAVARGPAVIWHYKVIAQAQSPVTAGAAGTEGGQGGLVLGIGGVGGKRSTGGTGAQARHSAVAHRRPQHPLHRKCNCRISSSTLH